MEANGKMDSETNKKFGKITNTFNMIYLLD